MSKQAGITYIFMWHSLTDACPKCQMLNGHEWYEQDLFQDILWDPLFGNLWDLNNDIPLTHSHCRCQLEVRVELNLDQLPSMLDFKLALQEFGLNVE